MTVLTFNLSVTDKDNIASVSEPFQMMPATRTIMSDKQIEAYKNAANDKIILHMNYVTRVFKPEAIEVESKERYSLRQYVKLATKLGTRNILLHLPCSSSEMSNLGIGMKVMHDEIIRKNMILHLEIPSWTKEYIKDLGLNASSSEVNGTEAVIDYLTKVLKIIESFPKDSCFIVLDTAHMFANGCEADDMIKIVQKFRPFMRYLHLNGNVNYKFTSDSHVPMFSAKNKIKNFEGMCSAIASEGLICVAEVTKEGGEWKDWEEFAEKFGFRLVKFNERFCY